MTVEFRVLKNSATPAIIEQMCLEMDRRMSMGEPNNGRSGDALRWKIGDLNDPDNSKDHYPALMGWFDSIMKQKELYPSLCKGRANLMAYVRQIRPNKLHTDHKPNQGYGHTIILPLRNIEPGVDRTVVFDHSTYVCPTVEKISAVNAQNRILDAHRNGPAVGNHIKQYQLEHLPPLINRLRVAGVFEYRLGDAVYFDGHALHASSNWKKYSPDRLHKDYVLIHTTDPNGLSFNESLVTHELLASDNPALRDD